MISKRSIKLPTELTDSDKDGIYENLKVLWEMVQNKPSTFPPSAHTHGDSDILGIDWSKVLNKPSVFPPSSHSHNITDINNAPTLLIKDNTTRSIDVSDLTFVEIQYVIRDQFIFKINGNSYTDAIKCYWVFAKSDGTLDTGSGNCSYFVVWSPSIEHGKFFLDIKNKLWTMIRYIYLRGGRYDKEIGIESMDVRGISDPINSLYIQPSNSDYLVIGW